MFILNLCTFDNGSGKDLILVFINLRHRNYRYPQTNNSIRLFSYNSDRKILRGARLIVAQTSNMYLHFQESLVPNHAKFVTSIIF